MNSIDLAHYPGCTLNSMASEIYEAMLQVCRRLDITLHALPDWNCCGSSYVDTVRPQLSVPLAARNLFQAQAMGMDLMVMCAGCAKRLQMAANQLRTDQTGQRIKRETTGDTLEQDLHVYHLMDLLPRRLQEKAYRDALQQPLTGLCYAPYYGCLLARSTELKENFKHHGSIEAVMRWLGAETRIWGNQARCCGGFLSLARPEPDIAIPMVTDIMDKAISAGAECVVTTCAMCQLNLELRSPVDRRLPVFSIVELLAYGLGSTDLPHWLSEHLIDPFPLFQAKRFNI